MSKKQESSAALVEQKKAEIMEMQKGWKASASDIDASDILLPRVLLAQPLLELVVDGKFQSGDILLGGSSPKLLAKRGESVEFIPVSTHKSFTIWKQTDRDPIYVRSEPLSPENINAPWQWSEGGENYRRDRILNFYVLPVDGISKEAEAMKKFQEEGELPDPDAALLPWALSFKKTSYNAGRDLVTWFKKCEHFGMPPFVSTWKLSAYLEKGEKGSYNVYKLEKGRKVEPEEMKAALKWSETIRSSKSIQVEPDIEEATPAVEDDGAY